MDESFGIDLDEGRLLTISDLEEIFKCGRSKASNMMHQLPHLNVGSRPLVSAKALNGYLEQHGGDIAVRWPRRHR